MEQHQQSDIDNVAQHFFWLVKGSVATVTLNRPEKRNALNFEMIAGLKEAFGAAEADQNVKVVVLRAKGESFCAGADLAYLQQMQGFSYEEIGRSHSGFCRSRLR